MFIRINLIVKFMVVIFIGDMYFYVVMLFDVFYIVFIIFLMVGNVI